MNNDQNFYIILALATGITLIIRILPFFLVNIVKFSRWLELFLHYLPLTMMTALFFNNLFDKNTRSIFPILNIENLLAIIPAIIIRYTKNSLMLVVLTGIACIAYIRYFLA
ncbi:MULTISPECIES: AzlD domain-containing protein [Leuconostoc]|uniref:AzlD domain-containing protein n=1 Tax=Leuconostoc TaxID=1243 RepID=UPI000B9D729C|nr:MULTISPECIES: AzlD domain-containing protein [Leuconostoc]MCJ2168128.1 AzlD domain-containing protein [Leuconostoc citreum]MCT3056926.1 AzlD domain-containing protein [Leuconostoc citreum]MCT3059497.1 AzlD domain-containing protein [Leuconostoc citreum]MCT3060424.1 AzlD domain-containing protein [Leuconostoc citreum]MCT3071301.1 AzlD domain-containing protein [Leuconostoc citreum]